MKKIFNLLLAVLVGTVFISCQNNADEWSAVTNKADAVGTWVATNTEQGVKITQTIVLKPDYSGSISMVMNYAGIQGVSVTEFEADFTSMESTLKLVYDSVVIDKTNKTITCNLSFDSDDFDDMIGNFEISGDKKKVRTTDGESNYVIYTKQ